MKKILSSLLVFSLASSLMACNVSAGSQYGIQYKNDVRKGITQYKIEKHDYTNAMIEYVANGDYLNFSKAKSFPKSKFQVDKHGVPITQYGNEFHYNPVTISQMGLHKHSHFVKLSNGKLKDEYKKGMLIQADKLIAMQSKDGAFRYSFDHRIPHLKVHYKKGWVSAMAQGQAMSLFARAYEVSGNTKYLESGKKALAFMNRAKDSGGTRTDLGDISSKYKKNIWFEEYISPKDNYTLNGYMFVLLGLYDWSKVKGGNYDQRLADSLFNQGLTSLKLLINKYDLGGFTSYDLSHLTMKQSPHVVTSYHRVHIQELHALYTITKDRTFKQIRDRFISQIK